MYTCFAGTKVQLLTLQCHAARTFGGLLARHSRRAGGLQRKALERQGGGQQVPCPFGKQWMRPSATSTRVQDLKLLMQHEFA